MSFAPEITSGHMFLKLEEELVTSLSSSPKVLERIENSIDFAREIEGDKEERFRSAFVRSAVTELVSIEDLQRRLLRSESSAPSVLYMNDSSNPLLCVVRELRNVNIHLSSSTLSSDTKDVLWGRMDKPDDAIPMSMKNYWIDNLDIQQFIELDNFERKYDRTEFELAMNWFNDRQRDWGITEILFRAATTYAKQLSSALL